MQWVLPAWSRANTWVAFPTKGTTMKLHVKKAAISAAKWALLLSAGIALVPLISSFLMGISIDPVVAGQKFAVGIVFLPILFIVFWVFGIISKKDMMTRIDITPSSSRSETVISELSTEKTTDILNRKISTWNYVGIGVGAFMLFFVFLPQVVSGKVPEQYYIGAAFWVGIIIYCFVNILNKR